MKNYGGLGKPMDYVVAAFIFHRNKVILVNHNKLKIWLPPGGHIEKDRDGKFIETPDEAVIREVKEETGLDAEIIDIYPKSDYMDPRIKFLHMPLFVNVHKIDDIHDHLCFDYVCKLKGGITEGTGDSEYRWFDVSEILASPNILPGVKHRIKLIADKIKLWI